MRLGFVLPHIGPWAGPDTLAQVATRAEEIGYDGLWVTERSLVPLEPITPYPLGPLPDAYRTVLDPLDSLTYVAPLTSRIGLGTAVLNLPWYSPVLLSRRLATIDVLSNGRLRLGVGQGWSHDEYIAAGIPWERRGRRFEEAIQVLKAIWTTDPVEFAGEFYTVPRSFIGPKPVQKPHPPVYVGSFMPAATARVGRLADGWLAAPMPVAAVAEMFGQIRASAEEAGRDPSALELLVRANVSLSEEPLGEERYVYTGSLEQVRADVAAALELGPAEIMFDVTFDSAMQSVADFVGRLELLFRLVEQAAAGAPP
jgi:probable F420-dependent oxidoreductase